MGARALDEKRTGAEIDQTPFCQQVMVAFFLRKGTMKYRESLIKPGQNVVFLSPVFGYQNPYSLQATIERRRKTPWKPRVQISWWS